MISVIVPVYNGAPILPTTLPAFAALEGVGEVVVVDDGSTDSTAVLLADVPGLRVVSLKANQGRSAARNAGARAARGDVLVFFDADVEPHPGSALALAEAMGPDGVASVARLDPVPSHPDDPFQDYVCHHPRGPARSLRPGVAVAWRFFLSGACAVRRPAFEAAGQFPTEVPYGEDVALACRLARAHPNGLRLADTTVRLHDLGDLRLALTHAAAFGRAAAAFEEPCPSGALDRFRRARALGWAAPLAAGVLRAGVRVLPVSLGRRRAVRYLLASTALSAARRA